MQRVDSIDPEGDQRVLVMMPPQTPTLPLASPVACSGWRGGAAAVRFASRVLAASHDLLFLTTLPHPTLLVAQGVVLVALLLACPRTSSSRCRVAL
jgi:hypothetical protein